MCDIKKVYRFKKYHVSVIINICAATENSKLKIYIKKHFNIYIGMPLQLLLISPKGTNRSFFKIE